MVRPSSSLQTYTWFELPSFCTILRICYSFGCLINSFRFLPFGDDGNDDDFTFVINFLFVVPYVFRIEMLKTDRRMDKPDNRIQIHTNIMLNSCTEIQTILPEDIFGLVVYLVWFYILKIIVLIFFCLVGGFNLSKKLRQL